MIADERKALYRIDVTLWRWEGPEQHRQPVHKYILTERPEWEPVHMRVLLSRFGRSDRDKSPNRMIPRLRVDLAYPIGASPLASISAVERKRLADQLKAVLEQRLAGYRIICDSTMIDTAPRNVA